MRSPPLTKLNAFLNATEAYTDSEIDNLTKEELLERTESALGLLFDTSATLTALTAVGRTDDKLNVAAIRDCINTRIAARLSLIQQFETERDLLKTEQLQRITQLDGLSTQALKNKHLPLKKKHQHVPLLLEHTLAPSNQNQTLLPLLLS